MSTPTSTNKTPRPAKTAPGAKALITAAALAATLGGWALFTAQEPIATATAQTTTITNGTQPQFPGNATVARTVRLPAPLAHTRSSR